MNGYRGEYYLTICTNCLLRKFRVYVRIKYESILNNILDDFRKRKIRLMYVDSENSECFNLLGTRRTDYFFPQKYYRNKEMEFIFNSRISERVTI